MRDKAGLFGNKGGLSTRKNDVPHVYHMYGTCVASKIIAKVSVYQDVIYSILLLATDAHFFF